jgi:TldD protein
MGTFGWDDEGVAAQAVPLVQNGIFVGYLSSRETAPRIGARAAARCAPTAGTGSRSSG